MRTLHIDTVAILRSETHRLRQALQALDEAVILVDAEGRIEWLNPAAGTLLGHDLDRVLGYPSSQLLHLFDQDELAIDLDPCRLLGQALAWTDATVLVRSDGEQRPVEGSAMPLLPPAESTAADGAPADGRAMTAGMVVILRDVGDRQRLTQRLTRQAQYDELTGLLNRPSFERHLEDALERARGRESGSTVAHQASAPNGAPEGAPEGAPQGTPVPIGDVLCHLDLDQFRVINETCGHAAGDMLVQWIASLIRERQGDADVLGRLGGDVFVLLVRDTTLADAERLAGEIHSALSHFRFVWQDKSFSIGTCIGLVWVSADFDDVAELASAADRACALAKRHGRGHTQVYQPDDAEIRRHQGQMNWVVRLRHALDEDLFELHWQRIAAVRPLISDGPLFFEVLVRLRGADGSLHLPGEFLPVAERFDLMPALDQWVVQHVLERLGGQSAAFLDALDGVTINLSGASIGDPRVLQFILDQLDRTGFPAQKLCFEITETAAVSNLARAVEMIEQLRRRRCRWALDDFGSGMSSFRYLRELPVDFVKIDGAISSDILDSPLSRAMVESIHRLAHVMDARTIAEKVESAPLLDALREIGVDMAQGFHIARPIAIRAAEAIDEHLPADGPTP